jgi:hypothetical protein
MTFPLVGRRVTNLALVASSSRSGFSRSINFPLRRLP